MHKEPMSSKKTKSKDRTMGGQYSTRKTDKPRRQAPDAVEYDRKYPKLGEKPVVIPVVVREIKQATNEQATENHHKRSKKEAMMRDDRTIDLSSSQHQLHSQNNSGSSSSLKALSAPGLRATLTKMFEDFDNDLRQVIKEVSNLGLSREQGGTLVSRMRNMDDNFRDTKKMVKAEVNLLNNKIDELYIENTKLNALQQAGSRVGQLRRQTALEDLKRSDNHILVEDNNMLKEALEATNAKIKQMEEQLNKKRSLWIDMHPEEFKTLRYSPKAGAYKPFDNLFRSLTVKNGATAEYSSTASAQAAPVDVGRSNNVKTNTVASTQAYKPLLATHTGETDPGDSHVLTMAVINPINAVTNAQAAQQLADFGNAIAGAFGYVFKLIEGWVRTYASQPNISSDLELFKRNVELWAHMQDLLFPGRKFDATNNVIALIRKSDDRVWFVMRMAVTYLCDEFLAIDAWKGFGKFTDAIFKQVKNGTTLENRQTLNERRAAAVKNITTAADYSAFRATKIQHYVEGLRTVLLEMISCELSSQQRRNAGQDLGVIANKAWELAEKIWESNLSVITLFPHIQHNRYTAANMTAVDTDLPPHMLQQEQSKLRLVITPTITVRSDINGVIQTKSLLTAKVLTT